MIEPFKDIALAFSGGGFRAAGFTFGTLSYLERIGLLPEVRAISSVSGGSITAVKYAQSLIDEQDFMTFFEEYYSYLKEDTLADDALADLNKKSIWDLPENMHKSRNAINSFAIQYNKLTHQKTLGDFHTYSLKKESKLKKLIINATDFSEAIQFRIKNISGNEKFGNNKSESSYLKDWRKVKLGDALAASSAFPGGFEPILFPNDFISGTQDVEDKISLMDGGIVDNQGASSLIPSSKSTRHKYKFYFVSDVASPYIDEPLQPLKAKLISMMISIVSSFFLLLLIVSLTVLFLYKGYIILYSIFLFLTAIMIAVQAGLLLASRKVNKMTGMKNRFRLPTGSLGKYIINRVHSVIFMMSIVMLKNNRRNNANTLYNRFRNTSINSTIYELRCEKNQFKKYPKPHPEHATSWDKIKLHTGEISIKIKEITKEASIFGTTLWFKNDTIMDKLISCGEFTACYNLIAFLAENEEMYSIDENSDRAKLLELLKSDWAEFQRNPQFLVDLRKSEFQSNTKNN